MAGFKPFLLAAALPLALGACMTSIPLGTPYVQVRATEWQVVAVNGRPTPPGGDYFMRFGFRDEFSARLGCNHMSGRYENLGGTIRVRNLASTRMACGEPAASFESQGGAILAARARADRLPTGRVTLRNPAGTIELEQRR